MSTEHTQGSVDPEPVASALYEAAARGADALAARMTPAGSLGDGILDCYKATWALALTGRTGAANRLLDWLAQHAMTSPGQFHLGQEPRELERSSTYRNAWIMLGAQALGRRDVASSAAESDFLDHQHATGAFHSDQAKSPEWLFNMNHTACGGLCCLYLGRHDAARAAADAVVQHLRQQPDLRTRYVIPWTAEGRLPSDPEPEQVMTYAKRDGLFFYWGKSVGFLAQAAMYFGEPAYLDAAANLAEIAFRLPAGFETWPFAGDPAWGAAWLYRASRRPVWRDLAIRLATGCFLETQGRDGTWSGVPVRLGGGLDPYTEPGTSMTAEFTMSSVQVAACLGVS